MHYGAKEENIFTYPFTSIKKQDILNHIIDEEDKLNLRTELGMTEDKIIISVGQFIHRKGFDTLIKSMKYLPNNIGVYIIGGTPTNEYIELRKQYNLKNLHFVEFKNKNELSKYYKSGDIFVLPTREDIWGLVINEAMAFGLPVISTQNCIAGIELVKENGYIVSCENYHELAMKITEIINDNKKIIGFSNKSLEIIQKYTIENMAKIHYDKFKYIKENKII